MVSLPRGASRARLLAPFTLLVALATALVLAGPAAAEVRSGEGPAMFGSETNPEAVLIKASASYDTETGAAAFTFTTAAEPQAEKGGNPNMDAAFLIDLLDVPSGCNVEELLAGNYIPPVLQIGGEYGVLGGEAELFKSKIGEEEPIVLGGAERVVSGDTTRVAIRSSRLVNLPFDCAIVDTTTGSGPMLAAFPISGPSAAPPAPTMTPPASPAPAPPAPAPAKLSIAKAKKPLKLRVGKSTTVKVTVTNTGGSATVPGSLKLKGAKGVVVTPSSQKLPALAPGDSRTVTYKVKLTAKAKKSSTLSLVGASGSLSAKGSLVVKLAA
jgi:hypothetical protein